MKLLCCLGGSAAHNRSNTAYESVRSCLNYTRLGFGRSTGNKSDRQTQTQTPKDHVRKILKNCQDSEVVASFTSSIVTVMQCPTCRGGTTEMFRIPVLSPPTPDKIRSMTVNFMTNTEAGAKSVRVDVPSLGTSGYLIRAVKAACRLGRTEKIRLYALTVKSPFRPIVSTDLLQIIPDSAIVIATTFDLPRSVEQVFREVHRRRWKPVYNGPKIEELSPRVTLNDCLMRLTMESYIDDRASWKCSHCERTQFGGKRKISILEASKFMVFEVQKELTDYPEDLRFKNWEGDLCIYTLFGVVSKAEGQGKYFARVRQLDGDGWVDESPDTTERYYPNLLFYKMA